MISEDLIFPKNMFLFSRVESVCVDCGSMMVVVSFSFTVIRKDGRIRHERKTNTITHEAWNCMLRKFAMRRNIVSTEQEDGKTNLSFHRYL